MAHAFLSATTISPLPPVFCGKTMFVTRRETRKAMSGSGLTSSGRREQQPVAHSGEHDRVMTAYKCRHCGGWHLGNQ